MARLIDVARAAGVSRSTVSNVFSKPERVSPEIRQRVEEAARRLNYGGPDPTGRALRGGKVNAIGFLPGMSLEGSFDHWPYFIEFLAGAAAECDARHAGLLLLSGIDEEAATRGVGSSLVDGFILHNASFVDQLVALAARRGVPFVAVDMKAPPSITSIRIDNKSGARQSVEHALALGHRKFAILSLMLPEREAQSPVYHAPGRRRRLVETFPDTLERYIGYTEALAAGGIAIGDVPVVESWPASSEGAALLLDRAPDATVVLAMADVLAFTVYDEVRKRGRIVPRDLSVVGFDDVPAAASAAPPLTTIAQPTREKGRLAAQLIFEPSAEPQHIVMPVHLVVRGSTASPRR